MRQMIRVWIALIVLLNSVGVSGQQSVKAIANVEAGLPRVAVETEDRAGKVEQPGAAVQPPKAAPSAPHIPPPPPPPESLVLSINVTPQGGVIPLGTRGTLEFPSGAVTQTIQVNAAITLTDKITLTFTPDVSFMAPVTLTLNLSGTQWAQNIKEGWEPVLYFVTESGGQEEISTSYNAFAQSMMVSLHHFSTYTVQDVFKINTPAPWKMNASMGDVGLFNGAMSYGYAIPAPAMPDGFVPQFAVHYNSAGIGGQDDMQMGNGWGMDVPRITIGMKIVQTDLNGDTTNEIKTDADYHLNLWGNDYALIPAGGGEYVPENYQAVRVKQCQAGQTCEGLLVNGWQENLAYSYQTTWGSLQVWCQTNSINITPTNQTYWQVWLPNGTRYVFGVDAASTKMAQLQGQRNTPYNPVYFTWYLKWVYIPGRDDVATGKRTLTMEYAEADKSISAGWQSGYGDCAANKAVYETKTRPLSAKYGNSLAAVTQPYEIGFEYTTTPTINTNTNRLERVVVKANGSEINRAQMTYVWVDTQAGITLGSITQKALKADGNYVDLPPSSFQYRYKSSSDPGFADFVNNGRGWLVEWINNGYGGASLYNYYDAGGTYPYSWVNYRVVSDTTTGVAWVNWYSRDNNSACRNEIGSSCFVSGRSLFSDTQHSVIGYPVVTMTTQSAITEGALYNSAVNYFYANEVKRAGKAYDTQALDNAGSIKARTQTAYVVSDTIGSAAAWFVAPYTVTETADGLTKETNYRYDDYGNTTVIAEQGYTDATGDERRTVRKYFPNASAWIVSAVAEEMVFSDGDRNTAETTGTFVYETVNSYDGNAWNRGNAG